MAVSISRIYVSQFVLLPPTNEMFNSTKLTTIYIRYLTAFVILIFEGTQSFKSPMVPSTKIRLEVAAGKTIHSAM